MNISRVDAERLRNVIASRLGLRFADTKLDDLADVLRARMRAIGHNTSDDYFNRFDARELIALAERLTVSETHFFRYREQFEAFREALIAARASPTFRILSAGCASGDEPYSLAITILEHAPELASRARIVAFDVNPTVIERASLARYSPWSLREVPSEILARYFVRHGATFQLSSEVRAMVRFEQRNLIEDDAAFWQPGAFDLVFCRNVVMYFDPETMRTVVRRIAEAMRPDALLFLGHAETLRGISSDFHLRHANATFFYQRKRDGDQHAPEKITKRVDVAPLPPPSTPAVDDTSWVEVIQRASDRVASLASRPPRPDAPSSPRVDHGKVLEMVREERFADALSLLGARDGEDQEARLLRATLLTNRGDLADAEQLCAAILAADDLNAGAHYVKALCREHAGDLEGAIGHDRMATYLEPTFAMPHIHIGLLERRTGHFDRARTELAAALELLAFEDSSRILLFGGGFSREALGALCRNEMRRCGGAP